jgi:hypothetical protein
MAANLLIYRETSKLLVGLIPQQTLSQTLNGRDQRRLAVAGRSRFVELVASIFKVFATFVALL